MEPTDDTDILTICRNRATSPHEIWLRSEPVAWQRSTSSAASRLPTSACH